MRKFHKMRLWCRCVADVKQVYQKNHKGPPIEHKYKGILVGAQVHFNSTKHKNAKHIKIEKYSNVI